MVLNNFKSIIYKIYFTFNIFFSLICLYLCENINPIEIQYNYNKIHVLSSGQSLELNIDNKLLICVYDLEVSNKINTENNNNSTDIKNIICLFLDSTSSSLYILNNANTFSNKIQLSVINIVANSNFNLIPYIDNNNNNLNCILTYNPRDNENYIIIINNIDFNKKKENKKEILKNQNFYNHHIGCGISDISNHYLTCCFADFNNYKISIYNFKIDDEFKIDNTKNITLEGISYQFKSSFSINKEQNIIFICYKILNFECFFYNRTNNNLNKVKNDFLACIDLKNYYFNETKEYIIICNENDKYYAYKKDNINLNEGFQKSQNSLTFNSDSVLFYNFQSIEYNLLDNDQTQSINLRRRSNYNSLYCGFFSEMINSIPDKPLYAVLSNIPYFIKNNAELNCINYLSSSDYNILIRPTSKIAVNKTDIDFFECESFLKSTNRIKNDSNLIIFLLELYNPNPISLTNQIEYKIYNSLDFKEIDISDCQMFNLSLNYSLKKDFSENDTELDIKLISYYRHFDVNLFDIDGVFYHDICQIYADFEYDVILEDRLKYLYQPYSICEEGCFFEDIDTNFVYCQCPFKNNINTTIPNITLGEPPTKFPKHYEIFKCFSLVISSDDKINNLGFYLITFMLGGHVPIWCYYLSTGIKPINDYITKEMIKFGYQKEKEKKNKNKNKIKNDNIKVKKKNSKKSKKQKDDNEEDDSHSKNVISGPPKKKDKKKSSEKKKKSKNGTYIKSCYIINNNNINNDINNDKIIKDNKKSKTIKKNRKKNTEIVKLSKKGKKIKYDNSKELMKNSSKSIEPNLIETQNIENEEKKENKDNDDNNEDYYYNGDEEEEKNYDDFNFINIPIDPTLKPEPRKESNKILNNYTYEEAIKSDKRSLLRIFYIFLLSKDIIFHSLILRSPFDSISVLGAAFIFIVSSQLFFNSLFYFDENVSKRFLYQENIFNFTMSTNMPNIFISLFIVYLFIYFVFILTNISKKIREIFEKEEENLKKDKKYVVTEERKKQIRKQIDNILTTQNKKNYFFFAFEIIIMLLYWYYITAFCHVYSNSQTSWIFNTFFTILFTFLINCIACLLFSLIYKTSIGNKSKSLYNVALFIYNI